MRRHYERLGMHDLRMFTLGEWGATEKKERDARKSAPGIAEYGAGRLEVSRHYWGEGGKMRVCVCAGSCGAQVANAIEAYVQ